MVYVQDESVNNKAVSMEKIFTAWGIIVILWSLYRANIHTSIWIDELIVKPLIFVLPIYYCLKIQSKTGFFKGLGFFPQRAFKELLFALFLGLVILGFGLLAGFSSKGQSIIAQGKLYLPNLIGLFILATFTALAEEVVGRGFLFNQLYSFTKSFVGSLFLSSLLFFVLYLPSILPTNISGSVLFMNLLLNFMLSFMSGILFYLRKNIYISIVFHLTILFLFSLIIP